jgi:hypothetical protein
MHTVVQFGVAVVFGPEWRGYDIGVLCAAYGDAAGADIDQSRVEGQYFFSEGQTAIENDFIIMELVVAPRPDGLADVEPIHDPQIMFGDGEFSIFQNIR